MKLNRGFLLLSLFGGFGVVVAGGQELAQVDGRHSHQALTGEIPNWAAPATWSPARPNEGLTAMGAVTSPLPFIGLQPCRVADTRGNGAPIQGGIFTNSESRNWMVSGICGIPSGAGAISVNFTVVAAGGIPAGSFLLAWPTGQPPPPTAIMTYGPGQILSNAAIVPLNSSGQLTVNVSGSTDIIMDVNGYYAMTPATSSDSFKVSNSGTYAIEGQTSDSAFASTGVLGLASATTGQTYGVLGLGISQSNGAVGVRGLQEGTAGATYGVLGSTFSTAAGAAGVYGVDGSGDPNVSAFGSAGVRGASRNGEGVLGVAGRAGNGVTGVSLNTSGQVQSGGTLAQNSVYGVFSSGNFGATGTKMFIEPHPSDASKVIRYVSLEGPESGTYFRGTTRTVHGETTIDVPESFRIVTDEEGLTVQLTPVGALATLAVISQDLDRIVVRSSKDVTFHYLAQGVRRAFKDHQAIADGPEFRPASATERMPLYLTEEAKRRLIANGTYNPDGTVNMETAERLGWTKAWKEREEQARTAAAANASAHASEWVERR